MSSQSSSQDVVFATNLPAEKQAAMWGVVTIAGIVLYIVIDVIAQILSPYNPLTQAESDLAVGFSFSWLMTLNFVIRGLLSFALIAGLMKGRSEAGRPKAGLILLGIWAAGALLLAAFPTDLPGGQPTQHGAIHLLVAIIAFICVAVGEIMVSRRFAADARWQSFSRVALTLAVLTLIACALILGVAALPVLKQVPGLIERLFLGLALLWMLIVAFRLWSLPQSPKARL